MTEEKKRNRRPKLRACLACFDKVKGRYRMTTPKTSKTAKNIPADAIFLLTDKLDPKDAKDIAIFRECLAQSEIGACFYFGGPVTFEMLKALEEGS